MQLVPKSRGQVSWSANPFDGHTEHVDPFGHAFQPSQSEPSTDFGMPDSPSRGFLPYLDSDLGALSVFLPEPDRQARPLSKPHAGRRAQAAGRDSEHGANGGRADPHSLRSHWASWLGAHPHAHGHARAAASLRVKEPELLHALEGHGVQALRPQLADLLAPAAGWGRLMAEVHHPLGFAFLALHPRQVHTEGGQVVLLEADRQLLLGGKAFAECFLIHGAGVCGLHGFDERGDLVARLHLSEAPVGSSPSQHAAAIQHLLAHGQHSGPPPECDPPIMTNRLTRPGWCTIERTLHTPEALARLSQALTDNLDHVPTMQFAMEGEGVILACQTTALHRAGAHASVPQHLKGCKVHVRLPALRHATVCTGPDGRPFLRLHAVDGHCLRFQHAGSVAETRAWIDALLAPVV